jgi:hypothetical protein
MWGAAPRPSQWASPLATLLRPTLYVQHAILLLILLTLVAFFICASSLYNVGRFFLYV